VQVINNVDSHLASSDHFQFAWFPLTDGCAVLDTNRTTKVYLQTKVLVTTKEFLMVNFSTKVMISLLLAVSVQEKRMFRRLHSVTQLIAIPYALRQQLV